MKPSIKFKTTRRLQRWSTAGRTAPVLITLVLACFALSPLVHAGCHDGCDAGKENTFLGEEALPNDDGGANTAVGYKALNGSNADNPTHDTVAVGSLVLAIGSGGFDNVAVGDEALQNNTSTENVAVGYRALHSNTSGTENVASGSGAMSSNTTGNANTAVGFGALFSNMSGANNTALGYFAGLTGSNNTATGAEALTNNSGDENTADGFHALMNNGDGINNVATGAYALLNNNGSENTADGYQALMSNVDGINNVATGAYALVDNNGSDNTADGYKALFLNTTGYDNTATGLFALGNNMTGNSNTADGVEALLYNGTGSYNTATGEGALLNNTTADRNTAAGYQALVLNTIGHDNTATGYLALGNNTSGSYNTAIGQTALFNNTTGSSNIAVDGGGLLTTGSYNIDIGNLGVAGESNTIRIGTQGGGRLGGQTATYIAGINGAGVMGVAVKVSASGQLGTAPSSARFKEEIQPMDKVSEVILALKPVSFRYKKEIDPDRIQQFGLVAEEVEKVNPDLVARDDKGKPYTVRYEAVNAMLLSEFLKEHKRVEAQQATIADLKSTVAQQQKSFQSRFAEQEKQIEALTSGLQKVSAQFEMRKEAPQVVANR